MLKVNIFVEIFVYENDSSFQRDHEIVNLRIFRANESFVYVNNGETRKRFLGPIMDLPIFTNFGCSSCPSVSSQLGVVNAIRTKINATAVHAAAVNPVLDLLMIFRTLDSPTRNPPNWNYFHFFNRSRRSCLFLSSMQFDGRIKKRQAHRHIEGGRARKFLGP